MSSSEPPPSTVVSAEDHAATFSQALHAFLQPTVNVSETIRAVVAQQQALNQEIENLNQKMGYASGIASPQQQKQLEQYVQKLRLSKQRIDALGKLLIGVKGRLWRVHTTLQARTRSVESDNALLVVQLERKVAGEASAQAQLSEVEAPTSTVATPAESVVAPQPEATHEEAVNHRDPNELTDEPATSASNTVEEAPPAREATEEPVAEQTASSSPAAVEDVPPTETSVLTNEVASDEIVPDPSEAPAVPDVSEAVAVPDVDEVVAAPAAQPTSGDERTPAPEPATASQEAAAEEAEQLLEPEVADEDKTPSKSSAAKGGAKSKKGGGKKR